MTPIRVSPTKKAQLKTPSRLSASSQPVDTHKLRQDRLGTLVCQLISKFEHSSSWEEFVEDFRGRSYLATELDHVTHPAAELLRQWRDEGVPAMNSSPPWTTEQKDQCIQRGCHQSAKDHADFLREEMAEFIENKSWVVLPYEIVRDQEHIMFAPAAVKDERDRKPRLLCDHSWPWLGWLSVNDTTIPHAPPEAMQFGRALQRLLWLIRHANPKFGPTKTNKQDLKDGFYRLFLKALDCLRLSVVLPKFEGEPQLIAIPLACTMGWVQSPPTFCAMSETVCDLANQAIRSNHATPPHRLDDEAAAQDDYEMSLDPRPRTTEETQADAILQSLPGVQALPTEPDEIAPPSNRPLNKPLGTTDVFVDDFIQVAQGGPKRLNKVRRHLFNAIDTVLDQPLPGETHRNEAVSLKKLRKGDGSWSTRKEILGWIIDTVRQTIELPAHRKLALATIFQDLASCRRVSNKTWQKYLGKLRFVSTAIPGCAGLFSALQVAHNRANGNRIRINASLRSHIDAFASLAASLCHRPTHLAEIVPQEPSFLGTTDAAKAGMGGVFYDHQGTPYVWRQPFPEDIQRNLVSFENPQGTITNSDLEQAGQLAQVSLIAERADVSYCTIGTGSDNTPSISRMNKGAVSSDGVAAQLCNYSGRHQRENRYCHFSFFLPGDRNGMADDASRLQHLTDSEFLAHLEQAYPQGKPWQLLHLSTELSSELNSILRSKLPASPLLPRPAGPRTNSLGSGLTSARNSRSPLPCIPLATPRTSSPTSSSLPCDIASTGNVTNLSELIQSRPHSPQWARGYPTWVSKIPASRLDQTSSIPYSLILSGPSTRKTTQQAESTLPTSPSSEHCSTPLMSSTPSLVPSTCTSSSSVLCPSTGSYGLENASTPKPPKPAAKPSSCKTSNSPWMVQCTMPSEHLCMTRTTSSASHTPPSRSLTKRMPSRANKLVTGPPPIRSGALPKP